MRSVRMNTQTQTEWLLRAPVHGFRIFSFNLSSRFTPNNCQLNVDLHWSNHKVQSAQFVSILVIILDLTLTNRFYCKTQVPGTRPQFLSSSKVNDGICDCCDGSDEWQGGTVPDFMRITGLFGSSIRVSMLFLRAHLNWVFFLSSSSKMLSRSLMIGWRKKNLKPWKGPLSSHSVCLSVRLWAGYRAYLLI